MPKFTNPLDNIRIASPCSSDWNEMYGNERKRFCSDCKLNVYNLSDMSRIQAENFLANSEGRLCVRFYRRKDGTVLTKDCPVGWKAVKRRISSMVTATFSFLIAFVGGQFTFNQSLEIKKHQSSSPSLKVQNATNHVFKVQISAVTPDIPAVVGRFEMGGAPSDYVLEAARHKRKQKR